MYIHTTSPDVNDDRAVTDDELDDFWPDWSPDGRRLVFSARKLSVPTPMQLFTVNADGTARAPLLADAPAASEDSPVWSPSGDRILFESNRSGDAELYTVRPDGTDLRRLTTSPGYDGSASWR